MTRARNLWIASALLAAGLGLLAGVVPLAVHDMRRPTAQLAACHGREDDWRLLAEEQDAVIRDLESALKLLMRTTNRAGQPL